MSVDLSKRSTSFVQFVSTAILIQRNCALWEFKQFSSKGTVPSWWIMQQSHHLEVLTASLVGETIKVNSIFPRVKADIKQRASHIQSAISLCFEIVQHMKTVKLAILNKIDIEDVQRVYSSMVRFAFNRFQEGSKEKDI